MSNNLDYIQELGIGSDDATQSDAETNDTGDIVQDSSTEESEVSTGGNTEPDISVELRKQIEGLEKRISDKDEYINTLREQSKAREEDSYGDNEDTDQVDDFWENPEKVIQDMKETMKIKKSNPARRKSFRARHNCDNPGPRHKARYWSCRAW